MAAKAKSGVSADAKKVLKALAKSKDPLANKQVAAEAGLEGKQVTTAMKDLKKEGLVESPVRCKYTITTAGKKVI
jgi:predicted transcriptional regulator